MAIFENSFQVRFAQNRFDLESSQKLRHKIFIKEMGGRFNDSRNGHAGLEVDKYDAYCKHLLLFDIGSSRVIQGELVASMRLMEQEDANNGVGFSSSAEYDLSPLLMSGNRCLEISRTCVHKNFRNSLALHYLWMELGRFASINKVKFLFGVASFPGNNVNTIKSALSFLFANYLAPADIRPSVLPSSSVDVSNIPLAEISKVAALREMPPLLKAYIRLGAKIGSGAFIDKLLNTIDVLIILDVEKMEGKYRNYYAKK